MNSALEVPPIESSTSHSTKLSRTLLVVHSVLITLIVVGTIMRIGFPMIYNPLESLWSDPQRHYHNAFDVKGEDLASILNAPGFEIYLSTLVRIIGQDRTLHSLAMAVLSALTPWLWYRWLRELTRDKTISLLGYALFTFLPSWFRIFGYFMDTVILLPLTGAGLWLTWRAARKMTWRSCMLAAIFCGAACSTKSVALPVVVIPWLFVCYKIAGRISKPVALKMVATSVAVVLSIYALGPLKVWSHTGAVVLMPDGLYNQHYFESGAHEIQVSNSYDRLGEGTYVAVSIWASSSVCYPPFYPFSGWMSSRKGRNYMDLDYRHGRDFSKPLKISLANRWHWTFENIIFFFFQYQWPEDNDWQDPFPRNLATMVRFVWFPLTVCLVGVILGWRRREFMGWYFIAVTLAYMFQQSAVMEGRYKKLWEGVALAACLNVVAGSKRYKRWHEIQGAEDNGGVSLPQMQHSVKSAPQAVATEPPQPEVAPPQPEVAPPQPEVAPPQPEVAPPQPEVAPPQPEAPPPQPEVAPPQPEVAPPQPEVAPPQPEAPPPQPGIAPPQPEAPQA